MLTSMEKYQHAKRLRSLFNQQTNIKKDIDKEKAVLLEYAEETGDKDFCWKDCKLTYVSGSAPKLVTNYKTACEEIADTANKKGFVTAEEIAEIIGKYTKQDDGKKPYFR